MHARIGAASSKSDVSGPIISNDVGGITAVAAIDSSCRAVVVITFAPFRIGWILQERTSRDPITNGRTYPLSYIWS